MIAQAFVMRRLICGFCVSLVALSAAHALDLTPKPGIRQGNEGPPSPTLEFADGKAKYSYVPPNDWKPSGGGNTLSFYTPSPSAWMKLMVVDKGKSQPQPDGAMSKEDLQAWAAKFIPRGAEKVEFVKLVPGPFPMGGRPVSEFIFNFESSGAPTSLSVSVVEFSDKERLLVMVSAATKNFERIHQEAISSMFSWAAIE